MNEIVFYENSVIAEELCFLQAAVGFGQANIEHTDKAIKRRIKMENTYDNSIFCSACRAGLYEP